MDGLRRIRGLLVAAAVVAYLVLIVPFVASGLVAPAEGVAVLLAGWIAGLVGLVLLARRRSWWALALPAAAVAFWFAVVTLGEVFLDWQA